MQAASEDAKHLPVFLWLFSGFVSVCPFSLGYIIPCTLLVYSETFDLLFNKTCLNAMSPLQCIESSKQPCCFFLSVQADTGTPLRYSFYREKKILRNMDTYSPN